MKTAMSQETRALETAAEALLEEGRKSGAEVAEVFGAYGRSTRISMEKGDFHLASSDTEYQLGLRVLIGNRQGFAALNCLNTRELKAAASKAVEIAQFSPGNPHSSICSSSNVPSSAPVDQLWDSQLAELSMETQKEWAQLMFSEATKAPLLRVNEGSVTVSSGTQVCLNTHGTHKSESQTVGAWSLMGMAVDGQNITSFDYFSEQSPHSTAIPSKIVESTRKFRETMVRALAHGPAKSYRGLVAFSPRAMLEILVSNLEYHLDGRNLLDGTSHWKPGDLNRCVLSPIFTLTDNPWLTDRMGATFFDREGTPTSNRTLIKEGRIAGWVLDNYAASGLKLSSTGNAVGGALTPPVSGTHCLCLEPGTQKWQDLLAKASRDQSEILLVHRFSGQSDPVTGDFSGVAKGADWLVSGERAYSVRETLISGNLFELLDSCVGLSRESLVVDSSQHSPSGLFGAVSVTAPAKKT